MATQLKWFEIPTNHFQNTKDFYEELFGIRLQEQELFGASFGIFQSSMNANGKVTRTSIVKGEKYDTQTKKRILYFRCVHSLKDTLKKALEFGGSVVKHSHDLGNEMGFVAEITDPEGNKLGLHSMT